MSMTREEIIKEYENAVVASGLAAAAGNEDAAKSYELFKAGLSALHPVSREQVEMVWRGCEYCSGDVDNRPYLDSKRLYLDKNGVLTDEIENIDILRLEFCPKCGKPLTDEAVEMVMERINEMEGTGNGLG